MTILLYGLPQHETRTDKKVLLSNKCQNNQDINLVIEMARLSGYYSFIITKQGN